MGSTPELTCTTCGNPAFPHPYRHPVTIHVKADQLPHAVSTVSMDLNWLDEILKGIDKDECDYEEGWWETSEGAEFGARKLAQLKDEITRRFYRTGGTHRMEACDAG